jgi:hypothetical protein
LTTREWVREYFWTIGAVIYVLFMFPVFYEYTFTHVIGYGVFDIIASIGAFIVVFQMFVAAFAKEPPLDRAENSRETNRPLSSSSSS